MPRVPGASGEWFGGRWLVVWDVVGPWLKAATVPETAIWGSAAERSHRTGAPRGRRQGGGLAAASGTREQCPGARRTAPRAVAWAPSAVGAAAPSEAGDLPSHAACLCCGPCPGRGSGVRPVEMTGERATRSPSPARGAGLGLGALPCGVRGRRPDSSPPRAPAAASTTVCQTLCPEASSRIALIFVSSIYFGKQILRSAIRNVTCTLGKGGLQSL